MAYQDVSVSLEASVSIAITENSQRTFSGSFHGEANMSCNPQVLVNCIPKTLTSEVDVSMSAYTAVNAYASFYGFSSIEMSVLKAVETYPIFADFQIPTYAITYEGFNPEGHESVPIIRHQYDDYPILFDITSFNEKITHSTNDLAFYFKAQVCGRCIIIPIANTSDNYGQDNHFLNFYAISEMVENAGEGIYHLYAEDSSGGITTVARGKLQIIDSILSCDYYGSCDYDRRE